MYIAENSDCEILVVDNQEQLTKYTSILHQLPNIKALIVWNDTLPSNPDSRFYTWSQFLALGHKKVDDETIFSMMSAQSPGEVCNYVYTSGTTGPPKGVMLTHDSMLWQQAVLFHELSKSIDFSEEERTVSYLPLSHVAAQNCDLLSQIGRGSIITFAKPDALQGTLVDTLREVRPTMFFAVPRVWEKFEERLKEIGNANGAFAKSIAGWAKGLGLKNSEAQLKGEKSPFGYGFANFLILSRIKKALGLDAAKMYLYGAAPLKAATCTYFMSLDIVIHNWYGMSETSGLVTMSLPGK